MSQNHQELQRADGSPVSVVPHQGSNTRVCRVTTCPHVSAAAPQPVCEPGAGGVRPGPAPRPPAAAHLHLPHGAGQVSRDWWRHGHVTSCWAGSAPWWRVTAPPPTSAPAPSRSPPSPGPSPCWCSSTPSQGADRCSGSR